MVRSAREGLWIQYVEVECTQYVSKYMFSANFCTFSRMRARSIYMVNCPKKSNCTVEKVRAERVSLQQ